MGPPAAWKTNPLRQNPLPAAAQLAHRRLRHDLAAQIDFDRVETYDPVSDPRDYLFQDPGKLRIPKPFRRSSPVKTRIDPSSPAG